MTSGTRWPFAEEGKAIGGYCSVQASSFDETLPPSSGSGSSSFAERGRPDAGEVPASFLYPYGWPPFCSHGKLEFRLSFMLGQ